MEKFKTKKERDNTIITLRKRGLTTYKIAELMNMKRTRISSILIKHGYGTYKIKNVSIDLLKQNPEILGELLGIFSADGNCYKSGHHFIIRFSLSADERDYAENLMNLFSFYLCKKPFIYYEQHGSGIVLKYNSRVLKDLLREYLDWESKKSYSICLKTTNHPKDFLTGFIRGFLDCDGYTHKTQRKVSLFCISEKIMRQIFTIISDFGFDPDFYVYYDKRKNRKPMYFVNLVKDDAAKFIDFVQPRNEKRKKWVQGDLNSRLKLFMN